MSKHVSPQLEALCIGALLDADGPVLRSDAATLLGSSGLAPEDFSNPTLKAFASAIATLAARQRPCEPATVLATCRGLPDVPKDALPRLEALRGANTANRQAFLTHAEELRRLSHLRRLESFHRAQLEALSRPRPDPAKLVGEVDSFARSLAAATQPDETGDADMFELLEDWDAYAKGIRQQVVPTGIQLLDEKLGKPGLYTGGWVCNLNVIGGLPSVGKSALAGTSIHAALASGMRVGVFGLEDATKWISKRLLARSMSLPVGAIANCRLNDYQQERAQEEAGRIANLTRNMLVYRRSGITPETLVQTAKRWILVHGAQILFIDHGGEVQHDGGGKSDRFDLAVARTYEALRDLAVNHKVPVVVLCHFNRESGSGRPTQQSFAESAYIERRARVAIGLWEVEGRPEELRVTILKATEGQRNVTIWLPREREYALVSPIGGGEVDERAELEAAQESRKPKRSWAREAMGGRG